MSFSIFRFSLCSHPTVLAGTPSLTHLPLPARNGIYPLMNFAAIRPHTLPQSSSQALEDPQKAQTPTPEPFDAETRKVRWLLRISSPLPLFGAQGGKRGGGLPLGLSSPPSFAPLQSVPPPPQ